MCRFASRKSVGCFEVAAAATLRAHFRVEFSGDLARWRMVLTPLSTRLLAAVQRITIEGEGGAVLTMETQGRDGHSRMTVTPAR